ncbi:MAG TPA: hypothetical protein VFP79_10105 [Pseudolabrys sp.]|nr:hypothetical protein [Pseudolabrys sp.]
MSPLRTGTITPTITELCYRLAVGWQECRDISWIDDLEPDEAQAALDALNAH